MRAFIFRKDIILSALFLFFVGSFSEILISPVKAAEGVWLARNGKAHVRVSKCSSGLCARIIWLRKPKDAQGRPLRDLNNSNPALRNRRIIGLPLFLRMQQKAPGSWEGQVYDPEKGGIYRGYLKTLSAKKMKVWGCLQAGWPCETYIWKRIR